MMKPNTNPNVREESADSIAADLLPTQGAPAAPHQPDSPTAAEPTALRPEDVAPLMDPQGSFCPEWYARFEELRPYASTLAKFRRPEALAKSYAHLERLRGYPGADDTDRMVAFRLAVGLPDKEEEFSLSRPENTPEEIWDDKLAAGLAKVAYHYGVPAAAMKALTEHYTTEAARMLSAYHDANQMAVEQADLTLQNEWGSHYEANMQTIGDFLTDMGNRTGTDLRPLLENPALRANADFAKLMLAIAEQTQEAPLHTGTPSDGPAEARRMASDPSHPLYEAYMRTSHPQHRFANEQYDRLAFGRKL